MSQKSSDQELNFIKIAISEMHNDLKNKIETNTNSIEKLNKNVSIISKIIINNFNKNQKISSHKIIELKNDKINIKNYISDNIEPFDNNINSLLSEFDNIKVIESNHHHDNLYNLDNDDKLIDVSNGKI